MTTHIVALDVTWAMGRRSLMWSQEWRSLSKQHDELASHELTRVETEGNGNPMQQVEATWDSSVGLKCLECLKLALKMPWDCLESQVRKVSIFRHNMAMQLAFTEMALFCSLQLTKVSIGLCKSNIKLDKHRRDLSKRFQNLQNQWIKCKGYWGLPISSLDG